jgi:hypothetical protein
MKRIAASLLLIVVLGGLAGCAPAKPSAADLKTQCYANEALIGAEMKIFYADAGIYPPIATVVEKLQRACPSGGVYTFDEKTGVVSCSVHGHP